MMDTNYDHDFFEWTQEQSHRLREAAATRVNLPIDWENLAEEIDCLGKSNRSSAVSHTARVIEHLLKLEHSPSAPPRADWAESTDRHRYEIERLLKDSPSLQPRLASELADCWRAARRFAARGLERDGVAEAELPVQCPYSLEQVLDFDWFPINRHGLR